MIMEYQNWSYKDLKLTKRISVLFYSYSTTLVINKQI